MPTLPGRDHIDTLCIQSRCLSATNPIVHVNTGYPIQVFRLGEHFLGRVDANHSTPAAGETTGQRAGPGPQVNYNLTRPTNAPP
jgi:hypothetical protein